jgi:hypothetical protein
MKKCNRFMTNDKLACSQNIMSPNVLEKKYRDDAR